MVKLRRRDLLIIGGSALSTGCVYFRWGASHEKYAVDAAKLTSDTLSIPMEALANLTPDKPLQVEPGGDFPDLLIAKDAGGELSIAVADCTHWGCTIDWSAEAQQWACPCHGSKFAKDGAVAEGPADEPLGMPKWSVAGETLSIELAPFRDA